MTESATQAREIFACNGATTVFTIPFKVDNEGDVRVAPMLISTGVQGADLVLNSDYTITNLGAANATLTTIGGSSPWANTYNLMVVRNVPLSQTNDYDDNDPFPAATLVAELDKLTQIVQQHADKLLRCLAAGEFTPFNTYNFDFPIPIDGGALVWDSGAAEWVSTDVSLATLQEQAALLAGIAADITTVANISSDVTSVAGNSANIDTVAGSITSVNTVATEIASVTAVASVNATDLHNVGDVAADVTTVAGIHANVTTVAGISANVTTVAGISANVTTVAGASAAVTAVAADLTAINAVNADLTAINAVNAALANINTVAGIAANVTTVAGISANVTTVAGISANVTTVAGIHTDISNVSAGAAVISAVAADLTNIDNVAADLTNIDNIAADLTNINNVAADLTNIDAVAADLTNIDAVAADLMNIDAVAGAASNMATIVANLTTITNAANNIPKANLSATTNPGVNDDNTQGYQAGSVWANTSGNTVWICASAGTGAASWTDVTAAGAGTFAGLTDVNVSSLADKDHIVYDTGTSKYINRTLANVKADLALDNVTNVAQMPSSYLDTDTTLAANSDAKVPSQKAIKTYVDSIVAGLSPKPAVRVATTANLTGTYLNGASGVGATFTYTSTGVDTVDGVSLALNDLILLKDQTSAFQNGIYKVTTAGAVGVAGILTRHTAYDTSAEIVEGTYTIAEEGTANTGRMYILTTSGAVTVGTTNLTFTNLAVASAAAGSLTGSTLAAGVTASSLTSVGTLTGGATGAGFTVALSTSTITGTLSGTNIASSVALAGSPTTTSQSSHDNSTKIATTAYVDNAAYNIEQQSKSTAYTTVLGDNGKHIYHPSSDNSARTFTIDSNANVAYPIGATLTFINEINTVTIAITSDTLVLAGTLSTGSRTLAAGGMATAIKVTSTRWWISGTGLT